MSHFYLKASCFTVVLCCRQWVVSENQFVLTGIVAGNPSGCEKRSLPDVYNFVGNQDVSIPIQSMQIIFFVVLGAWSHHLCLLVLVSPSQS